MAHIERFGEQQKYSKNISVLKKAWKKYLSLDKFTKGMVVSIMLLIAATPLIVTTVETFTQNASSISATAPAIYFGVSEPDASYDMRLVEQFEKDAAKKVSIIMFYIRWGDGYNYFNTTAMDNIRSHGAIPEITWEPWAGKILDPKYSLRQIINGSYDPYITKFAIDARTWNHPFFLRFAHEMNGNWYPWDEHVNSNKEGEYIKAWQHVHNIFLQNNVKNITWVWSPNAACADTIDCSENLAAFYPGETYVDWLGMDGYSTDIKWQTFSEIFAKTYANLSILTPLKPIMVSEMGVTEHAPSATSKSAWITDAYTVKLPNYFPKIKAVIWFNVDKSKQNESDWRVESSLAATQAFAKAVSNEYYMDNEYGQIVQSPIPPIGEYVHPTGVSNSVEPSTILPTVNRLTQ